MPKNTNILMIRHAEKPASGTQLAVAGQERAQAYSIYFQNYLLNSSPVKFDYLFAAADSSSSQRPRLTMTPLSVVINLPILMPETDKNYKTLANDLMTDAIYDNTNILICWHHGEILKFAKKLGAEASKLPKSSNFPAPPWNPKVFGWVLQLCYDANGAIIPAQTICLNQKLMFDDHGQNPPAVMEKLQPPKK